MYNHQYFIKEGMHVNPRYIVEFVLFPKPNADEDLSVASAGADLQGEEKKKGQDREGAHDFFDPVMYRSVSLEEKMSNVNLSRRLIPIEKAYGLAQEEAHKEDSILNHKLEWIDSKLSDVDVSVRKVNMNYAEQYDEIVSASEKAIAQLQQLSKSKLELLLGVEMELRREREEIEWIEGFINEKSNQAAELCVSNREEYLNFLNAWKSHAILRNGLSRAKPQEINILGNVHPDMIVHPDITVSTKDKLSSTLLSLSETRQSMSVEDQNDDDNQSTNTSAFNDCLTDAKHFFDAVATSSGLYCDKPAKPLESLISPDTQALVDRNISKIELSLSAALAESATSKRMMPLPDSITRSTVSGTLFPLPDNSNFKSAYNEKGNNENYTEAQLQLEMEKHIQHYAENELPSSEVGDEHHSAAHHRNTLADLRPLGQANQMKPAERSKPTRAESMRSPTSHTSSQKLSHSASLQSMNVQSSGFLTATEEFDGDLVLYLEQATEQYRPTYSLDEGAKRRQAQLTIANANFQLSEESVFFESEILEPEQAEVQDSSSFKFLASFTKSILSIYCASQQNLHVALTIAYIFKILFAPVQSLYLNLPFFSKPPVCKLVYSTYRDGSGLELLYDALQEVSGNIVLSSNAFPLFQFVFTTMFLLSYYIFGL
jgi:hypothetical protein